MEKDLIHNISCLWLHFKIHRQSKMEQKLNEIWPQTDRIKHVIESQHNRKRQSIYPEMESIYPETEVNIPRNEVSLSQHSER